VTRRLLLATRSAGKLRELEPLFAEAGFEALTLNQAGIAESADEDLIEAYDTFEENALAKVRYFQPLASGLPVVADDSGLAVHALGGAPGVRSKRWSSRKDLTGQELDDANNAKLLRELADKADWSAHYVCAAAFADGKREFVCRGETSGVIVETPVGIGGFGYDPYFLSDDLGVTFGEADRVSKEHVSHRGRAFAALVRAMHEGARSG
jgi:XTP/dITP diphosphohydrolase